ncbi:MAG: galactose mutarotase [Gemmatimonadetes bacterium]|nr:galactose mutarotase [Gemmatimonadota bacterium]
MHRRSNAAGGSVHGLLAPIFALPLLLPACAPPDPTPMRSIATAPFGTTSAGDAVTLFTMTNPAGIEVRAITYGGIITTLKTPDRDGNLDDIVLGFDSLEPYDAGSPYFGSIIGRYGNRIARGQFTLDGETFTLATNNGANHLHGGDIGFDKVVWTGEPFERDDAVGVVFTYTSPDGEEGYPGTLEVRVTYTLTDAGELIFDYHATADRATPVNLTQHSYFNLAGTAADDILGHELTIDASRYTPVDTTLIPTGELAPVEGTPFDFLSSTAIGSRIDDDHPQLAAGLGYDHNYVLDRTDADGLQRAAVVYEPFTGRTLEIRTEEPGIQFYSGNFLDGTITGKDGRIYGHRSGFCLETQHYPDSPNQPGFPSTVLRPGEEYSTRTVLIFGVGG